MMNTNPIKTPLRMRSVPFWSLAVVAVLVAVTSARTQMRPASVANTPGAAPAITFT